MKQSIILLIAVLTVVLCIVPMTVLASDATNPLEPAEETPVDPEDPELPEEYDGGLRIWGYIGLLSLFGLTFLMLYLEHKGILKDPMLK